MTDYTLIHIAALLVFILVIFALAALIEILVVGWKKTAPPPPHEHVVTWCDRNGHRIRSQDGFWVCAHCDECWNRLPNRGPVELGHQGQTGRAA